MAHIYYIRCTDVTKFSVYGLKYSPPCCRLSYVCYVKQNFNGDDCPRSGFIPLHVAIINVKLYLSVYICLFLPD